MEGYNTRLFNNKNIRGRLHLSRYYWLKKQVAAYCPKPNSVLELGCFDGKTLDYLPDTNFYYEGYDANWEGGLDLGKENLKDRANCALFFCDNVNFFKPAKEKFDISICMETLEHLPLEQLEPYIQKLAKHTMGYCFVTIPNEGGVILVIKYFIKKFVLRSIVEPYTTKELWFSTTGNINKVARNEGGHKGFDFQQLIPLLSKYFKVVSVEGIPFKVISKKMNFTVGIVLKGLD